MAIGLAFDWRRIYRWCLLATIVMVLWLLAPVIACSWDAFEDTPISEAPAAAPTGTDVERVEQGAGFWSRFGRGMKVCYARTPLLGQEPWKTNVLFALAVATLIARVLAYFDARGRRTFGDP